MKRTCYFFKIIILATLVFSCNTKSKGNYIKNANDTLEITMKIIDNNLVKKEFIKMPDTIYIIKSRDTPEKRLSETKKYKIVYIERSIKDEGLVDLSPSSWNDKRVRMDFGKFTISGDSANVLFVLYQHEKMGVFEGVLSKKGIWKVNHIQEKNTL